MTRIAPVRIVSKTKQPISSTDAGPLHSKWHEVCTVMPGQLFLACCEHVRPNGQRHTHSDNSCADRRNHWSSEPTSVHDQTTILYFGCEPAAWPHRRHTDIHKERCRERVCVCSHEMVSEHERNFAQTSIKIAREQRSGMERLGTHGNRRVCIAATNDARHSHVIDELLDLRGIANTDYLATIMSVAQHLERKHVRRNDNQCTTWNDTLNTKNYQ